MLNLDSIPEITSCRQIRAYEEMTEKVECFDSYSNIRELFKHFFRCSTLSRWDCFDFDKAFKVTIPFIEKKLNDHSMLSFDDYTSCMHMDIGCGWLSNETIEIVYSGYVKSHTMFSTRPEFMKLLDLLHQYNMIEYTKHELNEIVLFDKIIHAEHVSGYIFEWELKPDDPNSLRVKVDKELLF